LSVLERKLRYFGVCDDAWPRARREERKEVTLEVIHAWRYVICA